MIKRNGLNSNVNHSSAGLERVAIKARMQPPPRKFRFGAGSSTPSEHWVKTIMDTALLPDSCTNSDVKGSEIQEFFRDQNLLITGGTGFMGKLLIEKLLVSSPNIGTLYLLIREKRGKTFEQRFDELFSDDVFLRLRKLVPNFRCKVKPISGDCSKVRLGISDADYEFITNNISIIFHGAATVRFDEKLRTAININVRSVKEVIELSKQCKHLKCIIHTSTAYANCHILNHPIQEDFYPSTTDYKKLLEMTEVLTVEEMDKMVPALIKPWPNTYAFTKQVAESIVKTEGNGLPIAVFRPAVVSATYKEPIKAWTDNMYGPNGVIMGAGLGILRIVQCNLERETNLVPGDMAINGMIAAAWKTAKEFEAKKVQSTPVYNYVSTTRNPLTWGEFVDWNTVYGQNYPSQKALWNPGLVTVQSSLAYLICFFFLQAIPALLVDSVLLAMMKKPVLFKVSKKIYSFNEIIKYFCLNKFSFADQNVEQLWNELSPEDKEIFPFDIEDLDWDAFHQTLLLGLRIHLVKDGPETLTSAQLKWKRLIVLHRVTQLVLCLLLLWFLSTFYFNLW